MDNERCRVTQGFEGKDKNLELDVEEKHKPMKGGTGDMAPVKGKEEDFSSCVL